MGKLTEFSSRRGVGKVAFLVLEGGFGEEALALAEGSA